MYMAVAANTNVWVHVNITPFLIRKVTPCSNLKYEVPKKHGFYYVLSHMMH